jgi:hypothetical protein
MSERMSGAAYPDWWAGTGQFAQNNVPQLE